MKILFPSMHYIEECNCLMKFETFKTKFSNLHDH